MERAAEPLNRGFFTRMRRGVPYVRSKLAVSLDGRTALANGESQWITSAAARADVHRWRARSSAVVTGSGTDRRRRSVARRAARGSANRGVARHQAAAARRHRRSAQDAAGRQDAVAARRGARADDARARRSESRGAARGRSARRANSRRRRALRSARRDRALGRARDQRRVGRGRRRLERRAAAEPGSSTSSLSIWRRVCSATRRAACSKCRRSSRWLTDDRVTFDDFRKVGADLRITARVSRVAGA